MQKETITTVEKILEHEPFTEYDYEALVYLSKEIHKLQTKWDAWQYKIYLEIWHGIRERGVVTLYYRTAPKFLPLNLTPEMESIETIQFTRGDFYYQGQLQDNLIQDAAYNYCNKQMKILTGKL